MSINKIIVDTTTGAGAAESINEVIDIVESTSGGSTGQVLSKTGEGDYEWDWAAPLTGATGPQGPTGATGAEGATGLTGATGAAGDPPGLINGQGTDSIISAAALTPTSPPIATGTRSINLGFGGSSAGQDSIAIGNATTFAGSTSGIAIGTGAITDGLSGVALGGGSRAFSRDGISIGDNSYSLENFSINIGYRGFSNGANSIGIGFRPFNALKAVQDGIAIGNEARADSGVAIGHISIGKNTEVKEENGIAIGSNATSTSGDGVALGAGVVAAHAGWVSLKRLQATEWATLDFADDAAAATGGVPLGGFYHTSGVVKIRIV